jgi:hypothetical protein
MVSDFRKRKFHSIFHDTLRSGRLLAALLLSLQTIILCRDFVVFGLTDDACGLAYSAFENRLDSGATFALVPSQVNRLVTRLVDFNRDNLCHQFDLGSRNCNWTFPLTTLRPKNFKPFFAAVFMSTFST